MGDQRGAWPGKKFTLSFIFTICIVIMGFIVYESMELKTETQNERYYQDLSRLINENDGTYIPSIQLSMDDESMLVASQSVQGIVESEAVGASMEYAPETQTTVIKADGRTITLHVGSNIMEVNETRQTLPVAPMIEDGQLLLPLREIAENLAFHVAWNSESSQASLSRPFQTKRLLAASSDGSPVSGFGEMEMLSAPDGLSVLQFKTEYEAISAHENINSQGNASYLGPDEMLFPGSHSWGVAKIAADKYVDFLEDGKNTNRTVVAVVDTGVDTTHPFLKNNLIPGKNMYDSSAKMYDDIGHGTHVSGTIVDCASNYAKIMPVKVFGSSEGKGSIALINAGIYWAVDNGAQVINLSFDFPERTYSSGGFAAAYHYAASKGVVIVKAAGNSHDDTAYYDGSNAANVIIVSAIDVDGTFASFSNYGKAVDLAAPGVNIISSVPGGGFQSMSGTSMATPHVSGLLALLLAHDPSLSPSSVELLLYANAIDLGPPGWDEEFGAGAVSVEKLTTNKLITDNER